MMSIKLCAAFAIACFIIGCHRNVAPISLVKPTAAAHQTDGKSLEWGSAYQPSEYPGLSYQVAYNKSNLYVCVRIWDQQNQFLAIQQGMAIYVDTTTKQRESRGIRFPLPLTEGQIQQLSTQREKADLERKYSELCQEFELFGFSTETLRATNLSSRDIKASVAFDEAGAMICEYQLPWKIIFKSPMQFNEFVGVHIKIQERKADPTDDPSPSPNTMGGNGMSGMGGNPFGTSGMMGQQGGVNGMSANPLNPNQGQAQQPAMRSQPAMPHVWAKFKLSAE